MTVLAILQYPNQRLRKIGKQVENFDDPAFQKIVDDMFETMYENDGIGLAAPQVSRSEQLLVMGCEGEGAFPETVLINPKIVFYGPQQVEMWEGCLSVDGLRGKVMRPSTIRVQALDRHGTTLDFEATGLFGVCIQHEMDHLIGKVFLDRMTDLSTLTQLKEFEAYWKQEPATVI